MSPSVLHENQLGNLRDYLSKCGGGAVHSEDCVLLNNIVDLVYALCFVVAGGDGGVVVVVFVLCLFICTQRI